MAIHVLRMTGRFTQSKKSKPIERSCYFVWNTNNKQVLFAFLWGVVFVRFFLKGFSPPSILFYSLSVNQLLRLLPSIHSFPLLGYCFPLGSINGPYCSIVSKTLKTIVLKVGYCELLSVSALLF